MQSILLRPYILVLLWICLPHSLYAQTKKSAAPKERLIQSLEHYGSSPSQDEKRVKKLLSELESAPTGFDVQTWKEATRLLSEEEALNFTTLKAIVENTGRIQSPHGILSTEKEAMLYTIRAILRRKLRQTKNRLPWTFLLGQTQFFLGEPDNFYLKYYIKKGNDPVQLARAKEMLEQNKP